MYEIDSIQFGVAGVSGVFLESLMEITSERNVQADDGFKKKKRKMLELVSKLFEEFDINKGNTLDQTEFFEMLKALSKHEADLEQVQEISVWLLVLLVLMCAISLRILMCAARLVFLTGN